MNPNTFDGYDADTRAAARWLLMSHGFMLTSFDEWLTGDDFADVVRDYYRRDRDKLVAAANAGNKEAAYFGARYLTTVRKMDQRQEYLGPLAEHGQKMRKGRKLGTVGPVRKWIRKYLSEHSDARTSETWAALKKRTPKNMTVLENRIGKYIETDGASDTSYRQFANLVSLERPKK